MSRWEDSPEPGQLSLAWEPMRQGLMGVPAARGQGRPAFLGPAARDIAGCSISVCLGQCSTSICSAAGTTGHPKAAMLSHRNILNNGLYVAYTCKYTDADRWAAGVPLLCSGWCSNCTRLHAVDGVERAGRTGAGMALLQHHLHTLCSSVSHRLPPRHAWHLQLH